MSKQVEDFLATALEGYLSSDLILKFKSEDTIKKYFRESTSLATGTREQEEDGQVVPSWVSNGALLKFAATHKVEDVRRLLSTELHYAVRPRKAAAGGGGGDYALRAGLGLPLSATGNPNATPGFTFQEALLALIHDDSIGVASAACGTLLELLATAQQESDAEEKGEVWSMFASYWGGVLPGALLQDTNSPSPYRCMMRIGDALGEMKNGTDESGVQRAKDAALALSRIAKESISTFFHAATISVTQDVLQFVNFISLIQTLLCSGGVEMPTELGDSILQQLKRPTHDDPFAALAKPQLLLFVGYCARSSNGQFLQGSALKSWTVEVLHQAVALGHGNNGSQSDSVSEEEMAALRALSVPYLESLGWIGSSADGMRLIRSTVASREDLSALFHGLLWHAMKSRHSDLMEAALYAMHMLLLCRPSSTTVEEAEEDDASLDAFVADYVVSKVLFREHVWPQNKHFEPLVRVRLWNALTSLLSWPKAGATSANPSNGVGQVAFTLAGSWLVGPENREPEVEVRTEQLSFMKKVGQLSFQRKKKMAALRKEQQGAEAAPEEVDPAQAAIAVLEAKIQNEWDKGLYPRRTGPQTDAGVAE